MFILFGWGTQTERNEGPIDPHACENCGQEASWYLYRISRWITFFLVPTIPYTTKRFQVCPNCDYAVEVKGKEADYLTKLARLNKQLQKGRIQRGQYELELQRLKRQYGK
jgi:hypothetical protein